MKMQQLSKQFIICLLILLTPLASIAQKVGVFFDSNVPQIQFAAQDVKKALESRKLGVEMLPLSALKSSYSNSKVVIALTTDASVSSQLLGQAGKKMDKLTAQAYAIQTTSKPQKSYWIFGGDANGAMYGGLQIAENILFYGLEGKYDLTETPDILQRGIKLNLPFDTRSTTYFNNNNSTSTKNAIPNVWDFSFWSTWFDEMARNRYNIISVWNNHPFTSMIKLDEYPDVVIEDVKAYKDIYNTKEKTEVLLKQMTIEQKIVHWKKVMEYAKNRGFKFYLFNWNLFLGTANNKYGITERAEGVTNEKTIAYLRKSMYQLLKTYPDLDGFGVTEGEGMSKDKVANSKFLGASYGQGMVDFAKDHPNRKVHFIHRWHMADFSHINENFKELMHLPNADFTMSFKYSSGHMYSSTKPDFLKKENIENLKENSLKSWFTVRNDDFYFHDWADLKYAREYINNLPKGEGWFNGFYIGGDGFNPTRTFFSKNSVSQGKLEVQRQWYMNKLWGRLTYNSNTPDQVFINHLKLRFPDVNADQLFNAWTKASRGLPKVGELIFDKMHLDFQWYPENCQTKDGFITIKEFADATTISTSNLCDIKNSANNTCNGKLSAITVADQIEADAMEALGLIKSMPIEKNTDLSVTLNNIRAMSYLTIYYAYKVRGAVWYTAGDLDKAKSQLASAYCWWMQYTNLMDDMYTGMSCQRSFNFSNWHEHDAAVLKEYQIIGGANIPNCNIENKF